MAGVTPVFRLRARAAAAAPPPPPPAPDAPPTVHDAAPAVDEAPPAVDEAPLAVDDDDPADDDGVRDDDETLDWDLDDDAAVDADDDGDAAVARLAARLAPVRHLTVRGRPADAARNHAAWARLCATLAAAGTPGRVRSLRFLGVDVPDALADRLVAATAPSWPAVETLAVDGCRCPPGVVRALVARCQPALAALTLDADATRDWLARGAARPRPRLSPALRRVELTTPDPDRAAQDALYRDWLADAGDCTVVWNLRRPAS